jgi:hypothetical protein
MNFHKRNYFKKLIENNRNSLRNLWRILTSVMKFDFTFCSKESETEIDIENINKFFVSERQKVSDECFSSIDKQEVTEERIKINSNSDSTRDNGSNFPQMSQNNLKEALNGMHSKNSCGIDIITNKMLKLIGPLLSLLLSFLIFLHSLI